MLVKNLRSESEVTLNYGNNQSALLNIDDLVVTETPKSGWSVASHSGESVALDLELTPELIQAGLVREVIRAIQEERKNSGFDISDRINVSWNAQGDTTAAINSAVAAISEEVLAVTFSQDASLVIGETEIGLGLKLTLGNNLGN